MKKYNITLIVFVLLFAIILFGNLIKNNFKTFDKDKQMYYDVNVNEKKLKGLNRINGGDIYVEFYAG